MLSWPTRDDGFPKTSDNSSDKISDNSSDKISLETKRIQNPMSIPTLASLSAIHGSSNDHS